MMSKVLVR